MYAFGSNGLPYGGADSTGVLFDFGIPSRPSSPPTPADLDGDGVDELYIAGEDAFFRGYDVPPGTISFREIMEDVAPVFEIPPTDPEDPALLHFTSGTTGRPKGALHVHEAVVAHHATAEFALDLRAGDVFWCTADPGWVTGTSYGIIAPLTHGLTMIVDEADFDAERWYAILGQQRVSVWYTAPTAVRMMMKGGAEAARRHAFPALRFIASALLYSVGFDATFDVFPSDGHWEITLAGRAGL